MRKTMMALVLAATATASVPALASAQECTNGYIKCLNDTHDLKGLLQILADIECFRDYVRCVG